MTQFEITDDNRPYLEARGKIILNACPGSGKTTAIAYKMSQLTRECETNHGPFAGIACLSFTNVAKAEIAAKFRKLTHRQLDFPHVVLTLDSFINQYITLPFYHLFGKKSKRPVILDVVSFLDQMNLGYFPAKLNQPLTKILAPSKLKMEIDGTINWKGNRPKPETVDLAIFDRYAITFKDWQFENGYLNNDDSTYIAYKLLKAYPSISESLIKRFSHIIIDEAQDTSEIQYKIFDLLVAAGLSNMEYVGDPYQSLYGFREARPDLFLERFNNVQHWQSLRLKDCRRTSQQIIDAYSLFRAPGEMKIDSVCAHATDHTVKILRFDPANLTDLMDRYGAIVKPAEQNYILVRGSTHLEMFGVKPSSEQPWKNEAARTLVESQTEFNLGNTKAAVDNLRKFLAEVQLPDADHKTQRDHLETMKINIDINIQLFELLRKMPSIDDTLQGWTEKITVLVKTELGFDVDLQLKQKGKAFYEKILRSLLYPTITRSYPVNTIHKVKGMTFKSVLLVLSDNSTGANISLADFVKPAGLPNEKQRIIYVALSRPETLACIAIPNSINETKIRLALGDKIEFL